MPFSSCVVVQEKKMCAQAVKNRKTGYYEIGLVASSPKNSDLPGDGNYSASASLDAACSQCRRPFTLTDLTVWRDMIVKQPIVGLNGERDFDPAWHAIFNDAACPRLCCRRTFLKFIPEDVWEALFDAANYVLPPDWTFDLYVKTKDLTTDPAPPVTQFGTTASADYYYMQRAKSRGTLF